MSFIGDASCFPDMKKGNLASVNTALLSPARPLRSQ